MRISDWSSDVCSSDLLNVAEWADGMHAHPLATLPAPAHLPPAGEGARRADEGASAASCFWVSPGKQLKSTLRCARAPSSGASRHLLPQAGEGLRSGLIPSGASRTAYGEERSPLAAPTGLRGSDRKSTRMNSSP